MVACVDQLQGLKCGGGGDKGNTVEFEEVAGEEGKNAGAGAGAGTGAGTAEHAEGDVGRVQLVFRVG